MFTKYIIFTLAIVCLTQNAFGQFCNQCSTCQCQCSNYVVCPGDTYSSISQRFGTSVAALCAANPNVNPNNLRIGSTLCVPTLAAYPQYVFPLNTAAPANNPIYYPVQPYIQPSCQSSCVVQPQESCVQLCGRVGTYVTRIRQCNTYVNLQCSNLVPGQVIYY